MSTEISLRMKRLFLVIQCMEGTPKEIMSLLKQEKHTRQGGIYEFLSQWITNLCSLFLLNLFFL